MEDRLDYFLRRTRDHITRVQRAAESIVAVFPEFRPLIDICANHDASKLIEPERTPYIDLTWNKFKGIKEVTPLINDATRHHIINNSHHPEYWNKKEANISASDRDKSNTPIPVPEMTPMAIAEMVADWQAMAEELRTNTAREWYNKTRNVRWIFNPYQEGLIDALLKVFECTSISMWPDNHIEGLIDAALVVSESPRTL